MRKKSLAVWFPVICSAAFVLGTFAGFVKVYLKNGNEVQNVPEADAAKMVIEEEETLIPREKTTLHYVVSIDGGSLVLLQVFDDNSENVVESADINKSVLPKNDILLLEKGIVFSDKDEALMMMENFVS